MCQQHVSAAPESTAAEQKAGNTLHPTTPHSSPAEIHTRRLPPLPLSFPPPPCLLFPPLPGVDVSRVVTKPGPTGRCTILSCNGQRTMRTCLTGCAKLTPEELQLGDYASGGARYAFLNACKWRSHSCQGRVPAEVGITRSAREGGRRKEEWVGCAMSFLMECVML